MNGEQGSATARPGSREFERDVHAVVRLIPPGRITSYGPSPAIWGPPGPAEWWVGP